jgi:hypothetical protein
MSNDDLNELLDRFDARYEKRQSGLSTEQSDEEIFIAEFEKMRSTSIKPTLTQLGDKIKARGHDYAFREGTFTPPRGSRTQPDEAFLRMQIYLSNEGKPEAGDDDRRCYIMFRTDSKKKVVQIVASDLTSTGGEVTKEGEFMVQQFTPIYVTEKFVHLFRRLSKKIL